MPPRKLILEEGDELSPLEVLLIDLLFIILLNLVLALNIVYPNVALFTEPLMID